MGIMSMNKKAYVYILLCSDNTLYTGYTFDLEKRIAIHNSRKGAKYTRSRIPATLVFRHECKNKNDAMKLEYKIKKLKRKDKLKLIENIIKVESI